MELRIFYCSAWHSGRCSRVWTLLGCSPLWCESRKNFSIGLVNQSGAKLAVMARNTACPVIPLGGYVKITMVCYDDLSDEKSSNTLLMKPLWKRLGNDGCRSYVNFYLCGVRVLVSLAIGVPAVKPVIGEVTPQSIVAEARWKWNGT